MSVGITKRALMEDYYMDEIGAIMQEWSHLHNPESDTEPEEVDAFRFFGEGGEWLT